MVRPEVELRGAQARPADPGRQDHRELLDLLDEHDPPLEDAETGLRIRRARPDESRLLTRMERAASEAAARAHLPARGVPVPDASTWPAAGAGCCVTGSSGCTSSSSSTPRSGFVAFDARDSSAPRRRASSNPTGLRSALLEYATTEIFDRRRRGSRSSGCLADNQPARAFYHSHHWTETERLGAASSRRTRRRSGWCGTNPSASPAKPSGALTRQEGSTDGCPPETLSGGTGGRARADDRELGHLSARADRFQGLLVCWAFCSLLPACSPPICGWCHPPMTRPALVASFISYGVMAYLIAFVFFARRPVRAHGAGCPRRRHRGS